MLHIYIMLLFDAYLTLRAAGVLSGLPYLTGILGMYGIFIWWTGPVVDLDLACSWSQDWRLDSYLLHFLLFKHLCFEILVVALRGKFLPSDCILWDQYCRPEFWEVVILDSLHFSSPFIFSLVDLYRGRCMLGFETGCACIDVVSRDPHIWGPDNLVSETKN